MPKGLSKLVGYNPTEFQAAAQAGGKIKSVKAESGVNVAAAAQALANQTGGNIMGFTYE